MLTDVIAETLTRIRNAQNAGHATVSVRHTKMVASILNVLKTEGFIEGYSEKPADKSSGVGYGTYEVSLRYLPDGQPMISQADRVSRPGRRVYTGSDKLPQVHRGLGVAIISTSQGVLPDRIARKQKIGGEVIAYIG